MASTLTPADSFRDLGLSVRAEQLLESLGCIIIADVLRLTDRDLVSEKPAGGRMVMRQVDRVLAEHGMARGDEKAPPAVPTGEAVPDHQSEPASQSGGLLYRIVLAVAYAGDGKNPDLWLAPFFARLKAGGVRTPGAVDCRPGHSVRCAWGATDPVDAAGMALHVVNAAKATGHTVIGVDVLAPAVPPEWAAEPEIRRSRTPSLLWPTVDVLYTARDELFRLAETADEKNRDQIVDLVGAVSMAIGGVVEHRNQDRLMRARQASKWRRVLDAVPEMASIVHGLMATADRGSPSRPDGGPIARGRCEEVEAPGTAQGRAWGCCGCNTANLDMARKACRHCGHERCDVSPDGVGGLPYEQEPDMQQWWDADRPTGLGLIFSNVAFDSYSTGGGAASAAFAFIGAVPQLRPFVLNWIVSMDWPTWRATVAATLSADDPRQADDRWWMFVRSFRLCCERIQREDRGERMGGVPNGSRSSQSEDGAPDATKAWQT